MDHEDKVSLALSVALTAVAGFVDAVGFLSLGHLFVSFMSGDSTQFAVSVSHAAWSKARAPAEIVALFVVGVIAGRLLGKWAKEWRRPLILLVDGGLLGSAAFVSGPSSMTVLLVLAMGIQNAAVHKAGDARMSLTYVTGSLVSFGERIADAFTDPRSHGKWSWLPYLLLWVGLILGAVGGGAAYAQFKLKALVIPASFSILLALFAAKPARPGKLKAPTDSGSPSPLAAGYRRSR